MSEKAKAAKREWARRYRATPAGREAVQAAQTKYWEKRYAEFEAERQARQRTKG